MRLKNNANQPSAALVNDFLQSFLKFQLSIVGHSVQFVMQTFVNQLMQRFSENVRFPYLFGVNLKFVKQVMHKLLGLFFCSDNRTDFRFNICAYHMYYPLQTEVLNQFSFYDVYYNVGFEILQGFFTFRKTVAIHKIYERKNYSWKYCKSIRWKWKRLEMMLVYSNKKCS